MPTKKITDEPDTPTGVDAESFDLLEWIESGTVARRTVTIYNDPALVTEYNELQARLDELGYDEDDDAVDRPGTRDVALGDLSEVEDVLKQMEALYTRWEASKSTWTVRAISRDEVQASFEELPDPKMPAPPNDNAPQRLREAFSERVQEYTRAKAKADEDRKLVLLATAVVGIEAPRGTVEGASFEQLKALRSRPHGEQWIALLYEAMEAATENDVEIPRPTSSGRSATSQG